MSRPRSITADTVGDDHGLALVMGDDDEGQPEACAAVPSARTGFHSRSFLSSAAIGSSSSKHARALDQRARQRHALALAAGKLVRLARAEIFQLDQRQHVGDARWRSRGLGQALLLQSKRDVGGDGEMRKQRVVLEHHVDGPPVRRHGRDIDAVEQNTARARPLEPGDQPQQRRLAAARWTEQRKKLAVDKCRERVRLPRQLPEALAQGFDAQERTQIRISPRRKISFRAGDRVHSDTSSEISPALLTQITFTDKCGGNYFLPVPGERNEETGRRQTVPVSASDQAGLTSSTASLASLRGSGP